MNGRARRVAAKWLSRLVRPNVGHVRVDGGIVSFTFDDFSRSAWVTGGKILEAHGTRGTYYACMGLAKMADPSDRMFDADDLREAHRRGHEIACHTYSHIDCSVAPAARVRTDIAQNAAAFASQLGAFAPVNFAYPYAQPAIGAKRMLAQRFASCRGGRPGINHGSVDFGEVRANEIRHARFDLGTIRALIDRNAAIGGWLIFFTHDVADRPSEFGCTPGELAAVVAHATGHGRILSVQQAVAAIGAL